MTDLMGTVDGEPRRLLPPTLKSRTMRPASILIVEDRTVYQALVGYLAERLENHLLSREVVFAIGGSPVAFGVSSSRRASPVSTSTRSVG